MKRLSSLFIVPALLLGACQPVQQGGEAIKLGLMAPLTGDAAALGADLLNGVRWAVENINADGGVGGKQLELVVQDTKCTGAEGAGAAQKLVNVDKVAAVISAECSGVTLAAAPIAEAAKVVLLSPASSNPDVTKAGDFIFRNYPSDALKTVAMAKYFKEKGYDRVALISENTDFSQGFRTALKAKLPATAAVFDETVEPGTKDFRTLFTRLKKVDFDVILLNPNSDAVLAVMIQQMREAGLKQEAISHDVAESMVIPEVAGEAAEGLRFINVPSSVGGTFATDYEMKYGKPQASVVWGAYGFDAVNILATVMRGGAMDGPAIRDALYDLPKYKGVVGTISFDENGDVIGIPFQLKEFQKGAIVTLQDIPLE
ncbi:MAG: branched-chain amino acid transport system substrate-binding protein [Candidatus Peregrinibacteria bacterium Gr01-1014_25]|nr:MAG: branched-chain amino acid transport system substrate-binding protein [Candidatus Peregrinibacteria bacterium Gr01-1014_25]